MSFRFWRSRMKKKTASEILRVIYIYWGGKVTFPAGFFSRANIGNSQALDEKFAHHRRWSWPSGGFTDRSGGTEKERHCLRNATESASVKKHVYRKRGTRLESSIDGFSEARTWRTTMTQPKTRTASGRWKFSFQWNGQRFVWGRKGLAPFRGLR